MTWCISTMCLIFLQVLPSKFQLKLESGIKSQSASPIFHQEALSVEYSICADQFEASSSPWATHGHLTVFCAPGGGEFEPCLGEVGNLNQRNVRVLILDVK